MKKMFNIIILFFSICVSAYTFISIIKNIFKNRNKKLYTNDPDFLYIKQEDKEKNILDGMEKQFTEKDKYKLGPEK